MAKIFRKPNPFPDRPYLLLIGAPRSGTTLLATMIGRHTDVGMLNEDVSGRGIGISLEKFYPDGVLDPARAYGVEQIWDRACRAASQEASGGTVTHDLAWFKEHGAFLAPLGTRITV